MIARPVSGAVVLSFVLCGSWLIQPAQTQQDYPCANDAGRYPKAPASGGRLLKCLEQHQSGSSQGRTETLARIRSGSSPATLQSRTTTPEPQVAREGFSVAFQSGQRDDKGHFLGGTELMNLVSYKGRLYAGNGYWEDVPGKDPSPGPQIVVLDSPRGAWRLEHAFSQKLSDGRPRFSRVASLRVVTFTTDGRGHPLREPVPMLIAGLDGLPGAVFSHNDRTGEWTEWTIHSRAGQFRALGFYRDPVTGADRIFAGGGNKIIRCTKLGGPRCGVVFSGTYDQSAPGRIRWGDRPEFAESVHRITAFTECNRRLYFSAGGNIYGRTADGPKPQWNKVYSYPYELQPHNSEGLRGLTTVRVGSGESILAGLEGNPGLILRIDPERGYSTTIELKVGEFLRQQWGTLVRRYVVVAYNEMPIVEDAETRQTFHLVGILAHCSLLGKEHSAWYLVRDPEARYSLHEIPPRLPSQNLAAVRTIIVSPFPQDAGGVLYFGGFDSEGLPTHNAAWIYRLGLKTALFETAEQSTGAHSSR
jgi:hypothetical protein